MRKVMVFVALAVLMLAALVACDAGTNSNTSEVQITDVNSVAPTAESFAKNFYARRPTQYTWPPVSKSVVQNAPDVLTKNYYLVIDGSGSMEDTGCSGNQQKIDVAKVAVNQFVSAIPDDANVGLLVFDAYGIGERVGLGMNQNAVKQRVQAITASGGTPLKSAMTAAYEALSLQAQKQFGYGEYHLIVVTDGEAGTDQDPGALVATMLRESPVIVHTIGFCIGSGHSLNVPGVTNYRAANNPEELLAGLQNVLAESNEYGVDNFDTAKDSQ